MPRLPRPRHAASLGLLAAACLTAPTAHAQQRGCEFGPGTGLFNSFEIPGAGRVTYVGRPHFICPDGVRIWADSAVAYSAQNMSHLIGRVRYLDRARELRADEARYFSQQARLQASGNVFLRDSVAGSEIRNGDLVYLRRASFRDQEQITVTVGADLVRPVANLRFRTAAEDTVGLPAADSAAGRAGVPADSAVADTAAAPLPVRARPVPRAGADTASTPYRVEADRLFLQGDQYFLATGSVAILRDSLNAFADSAEYDEVAGRMLLRGSAKVEGASYDLTGRTVNIAMPGGRITGIRASREAVLDGEDLRLRAPLIHLIMADGVLERLVATPLPGDPSTPLLTAADSADRARPVAEAEDFRLTADSVDVRAPGETLERITAVGGARGESLARDSLNVPSLPEIARSDWLEGDTLEATFARAEADPDLPPDTATRREYRLEGLWARGAARSLYRFMPSDTTARAGVDAPAVHYTTGSAIRIVFADGEVERMEVEGPTRGWHLEPGARRAGRDSIPPDSATVPPAGVVPPDTAAAPPPGPGDGRQERPEGREGEGGAALPATPPEQRGRGRRSRR